MDKEKVVSIIGVVITLVCILGISVYNIVVSSEEFFDATVYQIISLLFALIITFLLTQRKNDYRRKIDMIDKMIAGIQEDLSSREFVLYETDAQMNIALLKQKSLANRIQYLMDSKIHNKIGKDVEYIAKEMENLREFYGAHMKDKDYMDKSSADIEKYIVNINDKCFSMRLKLYEN